MFYDSFFSFNPQVDVLDSLHQSTATLQRTLPPSALKLSINASTRTCTRVLCDAHVKLTAPGMELQEFVHVRKFVSCRIAYLYEQY